MILKVIIILCVKPGMDIIKVNSDGSSFEILDVLVLRFCFFKKNSIIYKKKNWINNPHRKGI